MEEIKLMVMPNGEVKLEVRGVKGKKCLELTEFIEKELGLVVKREMTSEFNQSRVIDQDKVKTQSK